MGGGREHGVAFFLNFSGLGGGEVGSQILGAGVESFGS